MDVNLSMLLIIYKDAQYVYDKGTILEGADP